MPAKYANQNIIIIKKTPVQKDFLQISNKEWMQAARDCDKSLAAFKMYLYLAGNEIGYELGLSQVRIENELGIKKTGYYNAIKLLQKLGYLKDIGNNKMEFYTKSYFSSREENSSGEEKVIQNFSSGEEISSGKENSSRKEKVYETFNF